MAKSNREYWQERQIEAVLRSDENAKRIHQEMKKIYQDTADRINDEIAKFYGKFSKKNKIPLHELQKILSVQELGKWKKGLEGYLEQINLLREIDEKQADALLLELNLLSGSTRVNRLEALQAQIVAQMAYLAQLEDNKVREHLVEEYQGNYYRSMYDLYKINNPRVLNLMEQSRVRVDPIQVHDTLRLPWSGANYSQRIWKRQYDVANKVKNMVTRQLMVGTSMQSLTKEITAELGKDYKHAAERLVRTETAYAHTMADLEVYKRLGIEEYEYIATLDVKTSSICQSLDLKRFKVSEAQVGKNYPPMHPHCRSTTGIYDPEWDEETRIARGEDGKNYSVPSDMSYDTWYNYIEKENFFYAPNINDEQLRQIAEELKTVLQKNGSKHAKRMIEAIDNTNYIETAEMIGAFAYSTKRGAVIYNSQLAEMYSGIMDFVEIHELSHKLDFEVYRSWNNKEFSKAIQNARKTVFNDIEFFRSWFKNGGEYEDSIAISDIISALSNNEIITKAARPFSYWENPVMLPAEIFANLSAIDLLEQVEKEDIKKYFPELWKSYEEMTNEE